MENLHADLAISSMHRISNDPVLFDFLFGGHLGGVLENAPLHIRSNTASHDQAGTATGTLCIECRKAFEAIFGLFQAGVHGAHQGAVTQFGKTKVQWLKQVRVLGNAWRRARGHVCSPHRDLGRNAYK